MPNEDIKRVAAHYLLDLIDNLDPSEKPTAIATINDFTAAILISVAHERKTSIPESFSVTGFDNLPFTSHLPVPLTTVSQPGNEIGKRAAMKLFEIIKAPKNVR